MKNKKIQKQLIIVYIIGLNLILISLILYSFKLKHNQNALNFKYNQLKTDNTSFNKAIKNKPSTENNDTFPSKSFTQLQYGNISIEDSLSNFYKDKSFTLKLSYFNNADNQEKEGKEELYKISIPSTDYVSNPIVSPNIKHGCVTLLASGYAGYYIFDLETGSEIIQGEQYSGCIEWIDNENVILIDSPYFGKEIYYSILNINTKQKTKISKPF